MLKRIISVILAISMCLCIGTYVSADEIVDPLGITPVTLYLNQVYSNDLAAGEVHTYYFTPTESGLFTVETFGARNTYGTVHCTSPSGNFSDDNSGEGSNFAIGFRQNAGNTVTITVRHANSNMSGNYSIQVRRQAAQIYTFTYPDIDTTSDYINPTSSLSSMGYQVNHYHTQPSSHFFQQVSKFERMNSEVVFFSGHGNYMTLFFKNNEEMPSSDMKGHSMGNTKVAVWAACRSGLGSASSTINSVAQVSVDLGAKSAIGWLKDTNVAASRKWTDKFFEELAKGATVNSAAATAGSVSTWPWDGSYDGWHVFGDGNTVVINATVNPKNLGDKFNTISKEQFTAFLNSSEYEKHELKGLGYRYYKTIDGCLTNEFYDVINDGNTIIKSKNTVDDIEVMNLPIHINSTYESIDLLDILEKDTSLDKIINIDEHNVYMKLDGSVIPIKISYVSFESEYGYVYQEVFCVNLLNNSYIDYSDICTE